MRLPQWVKVVSLTVPWCVVGWLGIQSHLSEDPYEAPVYGKAHSEAFDAYVMPVMVINQTMAIEDDANRMKQLRRASQAWVEARKSGTLVDVPRHGLDDTTRSGVRSQIVTAARRSATELIGNADRALLNGEPEQATNDLALAIEMLQFQKSNDIAAFHAQSNMELAAWERIQFHLSDLQPEVRSRLLTLMSPQLARTQWKTVCESELTMLRNRQTREQQLQARQVYEAILAGSIQSSPPVRPISYRGLRANELTALSLMRFAGKKLAVRAELVPETGLVAKSNVR